MRLLLVILFFAELASASLEERCGVVLVDLAAIGHSKRILPGYEEMDAGFANDLVVSPDGQQYAIPDKPGRDGKIRRFWIYDVATGRKVAAIEEPVLPIVGLDWLQPSLLVAVEPGVKGPRSHGIWNPLTGKKLFGVTMPKNAEGFDVSRDGSHFLHFSPTSNEEGAPYQLAISNSKSGKVVANYRFKPQLLALDYVHAFFGAGDSVLLVQGSATSPRWIDFGQNTTSTWTLETNRPRQLGHHDWKEVLVEMEKLSPWQTFDPEEAAKFKALEDRFFIPRSASVSPAGDRTVILSQSGVGVLCRTIVEFWDSKNRRLEKQLVLVHETVEKSLFSSDGRFVALVGDSFSYRDDGEAKDKVGVVHVWDVREKRVILKLTIGKDDFGAVTGAGFSPDRKRFFVSGRSGKIWRWDLSLSGG